MVTTIKWSDDPIFWGPSNRHPRTALSQPNGDITRGSSAVELKRDRGGVGSLFQKKTEFTQASIRTLAEKMTGVDKKFIYSSLLEVYSKSTDSRKLKAFENLLITFVKNKTLDKQDLIDKLLPMRAKVSHKVCQSIDRVLYRLAHLHPLSTTEATSCSEGDLLHEESDRPDELGDWRQGPDIMPRTGEKIDLGLFDLKSKATDSELRDAIKVNDGYLLTEEDGLVFLKCMAPDGSIHSELLEQDETGKLKPVTLQKAAVLRRYGLPEKAIEELREWIETKTYEFRKLAEAQERDGITYRPKAELPSPVFKKDPGFQEDPYSYAKVKQGVGVVRTLTFNYTKGTGMGDMPIKVNVRLASSEILIPNPLVDMHLAKGSQNTRELSRILVDGDFIHLVSGPKVSPDVRLLFVSKGQVNDVSIKSVYEENGDLKSDAAPRLEQLGVTSKVIKNFLAEKKSETKSTPVVVVTHSSAPAGSSVGDEEDFQDSQDEPGGGYSKLSDFNDDGSFGFDV